MGLTTTLTRQKEIRIRILIFYYLMKGSALKYHIWAIFWQFKQYSKTILFLNVQNVQN